MARKKKGELPSGNVRYKMYIGKDENKRRKYMSFTAPTMREARQKAAEWRETHDSAHSSNPTFKAACDAFIEHRTATLSPSTIAEYKRITKRLEKLYPDFCKKRMNVIGPEDVQQLINDLTNRENDNVLRKDGSRSVEKKISPKTIRNHYGFIRDVLNSQGVRISGIKLPQKQNVPLNIPENKIVTDLLKEIRGTDLEIPVLLAAFGPMRRGEICALEMEDIDFEAGVVHVHRNVVQNADRELVRKSPKTAAGERFITYPKEVTNRIKKRGYVTKWTPAALSHQFTRKLAELKIDHFRFHDLRHFSASFQIALGIPPEYIMERGGWNTNTTMRRYIHALDEQRAQMSEKTNAAFSEML